MCVSAGVGITVLIGTVSSKRPVVVGTVGLTGTGTGTCYGQGQGCDG